MISIALPRRGDGMSESLASPCVDICELNAGNVCRGCGRSLAEIAEWPAAADARKAQILQNCRHRLTEQTHD